MTAPARTSERQPAGSHTIILSLSVFLIGLYFGQSLPPAVDIVVLQSGLIGLLGFLALQHQATLSRQAAAAHRTEQRFEPPEQDQPTRSRPSRYVECRLDRHVATPHAHRRHLARLTVRNAATRNAAGTVDHAAPGTGRKPQPAGS